MVDILIIEKFPFTAHHLSLLSLAQGWWHDFQPKAYAKFKKMAEKENKDPETLLNKLVEKKLNDLKKAQEIMDYFFDNVRSSCRAAADGNCEVLDNGIDIFEVVKIIGG